MLCALIIFPVLVRSTQYGLLPHKTSTATAANFSNVYVNLREPFAFVWWSSRADRERSIAGISSSVDQTPNERTLWHANQQAQQAFDDDDDNGRCLCGWVMYALHSAVRKCTNER